MPNQSPVPKLSAVRTGLPRWRAVATIALSISALWHVQPTPAALAQQGAGKPNLLLIITDQQHAGMLSCAGNKWLQTPAMDSLAARGVRFELAYASNPVCIPSRVSMVTGHMPSRFGMRSNDEGRNPAPKEAIDQAMGWILRGAGYRTVYGGKTHWMRGMTIESIGFEQLTRDERDELADRCAEFLRQPHEKPFLLVASFINPHDICYMAIDDFTRSTGKEPMYPQSRVERQRLAEALQMPPGVSEDEFFARLCPPLPDNFEVPKLEAEAVALHYLSARSFRLWARENWDQRRWRQHRWAYCRLTEMVDRQIGHVLDALRSSGRDKDTVVIFTSDHGDLDAAHRLEHKSILYEEAARVPLIVGGPGVSRAGAVDRDHFVSVGLDLIPTLCDYAGVDPPPNLLGRSIRPLVDGRAADDWPDQVVVESQAGRMLRTKRFKYVVYQSGRYREQLIDLERDPGEMENLAEDPQFRNVLEQHRRRLRQWVEHAGDAIGATYVPGPGD